jgi:Glu-tRNA(Gln) amidotransferase subunit E-like FAD-binding protein
MMGLNFDNNGLYMGWSDLFSYNSLKEIEASEELPMPKGRKYINLELNKELADIIITKEESDSIINESNNVRKIQNIARLIKRLNKSVDKNTVSIGFEDDSIDGNAFVNNILNKHEQT